MHMALHACISNAINSIEPPPCMSNTATCSPGLHMTILGYTILKTIVLQIVSD